MEEETERVEVFWVDAVIGRGIRAKRKFEKNDFIVEYRGELLKGNEIKNQKEKYRKRNTSKSFMFEFEYQNQKFW